MFNEEHRDLQPVRLAALVEGGLIGLAWVLGLFLSQPPLASLRWDGADFIMGLVASVPMLGLFLALLRWPVGSLTHVGKFLLEFIRSLFGKSTLTELGIISLLAGVGEEMLFRGVLQGALTRWFGPAIGLTAASVLFGLGHMISPAYALVASLMGAYLGGLWQISDNLLVPIVTHAVYDFLAFYCLLKLGSRKHSPPG